MNKKNSDVSDKNLFKILIQLEQNSFSATDLFYYLEKAQHMLMSAMPAKNFYLWLYDPVVQKVEYVYDCDEYDDTDYIGQTGSLASPLVSPTAWVILNNEELNFRGGSELEENKWGIGTESSHWVGMPLSSKFGHCYGAVAIQSYDKEDTYTIKQLDFFRVFSKKLAKIVARYRDVENVHIIVDNKTTKLKKELERKALSEKLQQAVYETSSLNNQRIKLNDAYLKIHDVLNELINAKNIIISQYDKASNEVYFAYVVDEDDLEEFRGTTVSLGGSLTSHIIKRKKADILNAELLKAKLKTGEIKNVVGNAIFNSWIGAPMISGEEIYGVIVIQSYEEDIVYSQKDLELLQFVATKVAEMIEITKKTEVSEAAQLKIKQQHQTLEEKNSELNITLKELNKAQNKLIQQEKMNALGTLVAGVAHEVNTPLGVCITGISSSQNVSDNFKQDLLNKTLSATKLEAFIEKRKQFSKVITANIERANSLVDNFRAMSVDQSKIIFKTENLAALFTEINQFFFKEYQPHNLKISCPENSKLLTDRKVLLNVFKYLISNSIVHGFEGVKSGSIFIEVVDKPQSINIFYHDNGKGMPSDNLEKLFDPFYTTKRTSGGRGLGAHHMYNLVTTSLQGNLIASSPLNSGLRYEIQFQKN